MRICIDSFFVDLSYRYIEFAKFEIRCHEIDRARVIFKYGIDNVQGKKDTLVRENFTNEVDYEVEPLNKTFSIYDKAPTQWYINEDDKSWFKTKDELIDYLKTQIDRITTDDYTINYEAH